MANNTVLNVGAGGDSIRDLDRSGVKTQIVAIDLNPAGAETLMAGAMPVSGTFWQATQPVSLASVPSHAVTNAGTFATQATQAGTWTVTGAGGTFPVTGTFWQATQPVSLASLPTLPAGTNNIGDVDVLTLPALPAGTNLIGKTSTAQDTSSLYNGTTALTPKFATFTTSSSGQTTVVAAVTSKKIRVLRWRVTSNGTTNIKWQSHVTPTDISGLSYLTQFKDVGGGYCPVGHFETVAGEALDINNSAAVAISGEISYIEV
jgi:hypothetical protein